MSKQGSILNNHVKSSLWRTLIELECWVSNNLRLSDSPGDVESFLYQSCALSSEWPEEYEQHLYIHPLTNLPAVVVFLAGRAFLVGTPKGILDRLKDNLPQNLILLSWEESHRKDLIRYCEQFSTNHPLAIWTSSWIWEDIQLSARQEDCQDLLSAKALRQTRQSGEDRTSNAHIREQSKINYIGFEEHHTETFAPQVELSIHYEIGATSPRLYAQFRLFGSHLAVRLGKLKKWPDQPTPNEYRQEYLSNIYKQSPQARKVLRTVVRRRLRELRELAEADLPKKGRDTFRSGTQCFFTGSDKFYTYTIENRVLESSSDNSLSANLCPDQVRNAKTLWRKKFGTPQEWNKENVLNLENDLPLSPAKPTCLEETPKEPRIYLAIACGGLSIRSGGRIKPARRIFLDETSRVDISLLGMKVLDFFEDQRKEKPAFENALLLIPSPWTRDSVHEEMTRLLLEYRHLWEQSSNPPRILYLHQTVIYPRYRKTDNGRLAFYRQSEDNGFQYSPTGHFNFLCALFERTIQEQLGSFDDQTLIYYSNYNNLGRNINQEVSRLANHLLTQEDCPMLFELTHHLGEDSKPKDEGSYWVNKGNNSRLLKPVYCGFAEADWTQNRDQIVDRNQLHRLYMSTGSFLLHPCRFIKALPSNFQDNVPFYVRYKTPLVSFNDRNASSFRTLQFERDVDQITWLLDGCQGIAIENPDGTTRFFPVKQEKHLCKDGLQQLKGLYEDMRTEYV